MVARDKTEQIRRQIIETTDDLLYHRGFNLMSFSDIAEAAGVPRGNIYYYFKSKDEVLAAVIEHRIAQMKIMLEEWEQTIDTPLARLKRYARVALNEQDNVSRYGCPMGTLNTELGKSQPALQALSKAQFDVFRDWLTKQFHALLFHVDEGGNESEGADALALHMLARSQGLSAMAYIYKDKHIIQREVNAINDWLDGLVASD